MTSTSKIALTMTARALAWTLGGLLAATLAAELVPVGVALWKNGRG